MSSKPFKTPKEHFLHLYSIGTKLKMLRVSKNLTLARLGVETGYSVALLSKLETNRMIPTLLTLEAICHVYGIGLGYFFSEPQQHSLAITRNAHIADTRGASIARQFPLHVPTADGKLTSKILDLPPNVPSSVGERGGRTELTAYVLEGTLHVNIAGQAEVLQHGDCLVVNTDQVFMWSAAAPSRCRLLCVSAK